MKSKLIFLLIAATLLTPWPVAYAYENDLSDQPTAMITAADPSDAPGWEAFGMSIGSVTPGDLFYIDTTSATVDTPINLYLTNAGDLVGQYRYLIVRIGVYARDAHGEWTEFTETGTDIATSSYLTLHNGNTSFIVPAGAEYKISIDEGCFYCYGIAKGEEAVLPSFYLSSDQTGIN